MVPGSEGQEYLAIGIVWLDRAIYRHGSVDVFRVPKRVHQEGRHRDWFLGQDLVDRLILPERIVSRMFRDFAPESHLVQPALSA